MSQNLHTPWADATTYYTAASMTPPLKELDAIASVLARGRFTAADKDENDPPVGPSDLACYIVGPTPTGAWVGHAGDMTFYDADNTAWKFIDPVEGLTAYLADEDTEYIYNGSSWIKKSPYIVAGFYAGELEDAALCLRHTAVLEVDFPADLTGSYSKSGTAATAETVFSIKKNGVEFGTITYAISGSTGTLAAASATSFSAGDVLTIIGPGSADATLADVDFSLKGSR